MDKRNIGTLIELSSINGYVHKKGTDTYFKKGIIVGSVDDYEEVAEMPKYTHDEYVKKVRELIAERYTIEDEIAIFRQKDTKPDEYIEHNKYCEECKLKAKEEMTYGKESEVEGA